MKQQQMVVDLVKVAFVALIVKVMASSSLIMPWNSLVDNLCIVFAVGIMLIKLLRFTFSLGRLAALGAVAAFTLYTCVSMKQYDLLVTLIAICLLIDVDLEEYISLMLKIQTAILIGHLAVSGFLSLIGSDYEYWSVIDGRLRFNGGFLHSNVLSCYILSCMLMFAWKRFRRITPNQFGWMVCIAALSFIMARSRTGLLLNLFLLLMIFLTQKERPFMEKVLNPVLLLIFPGITAIIFLAQKLFVSGNSAAMILDDLMTGRIKYAAYAYMRSGVTWLPRYLDYADIGLVSWTPEWNLNTFTFDCLFSFLFTQMGLIWVGIITVLIALVCKRFDFRNKIFILYWVLLSVVEVHGLNGFKCFPLLLLSMLLSGKGAENHAAYKN